MKKATLLLIVGLLTLSSISFVSGAYTPPGEPICIEPCDPPVTVCICELATICASDCDGTEELLGVTADGMVIVHYKGKVYIYVPKTLTQK